MSVSVSEDGGCSSTSVADELATVCEMRLDDVEGDLEDTFRALVAGWGQRAQEEKRRRQNDVLNIVHPTVRPSVHRHTETSSWSIDTLETSVLQKKRDFELEAVLSLDVKGVFVDNTDSNAVQREGVKTTPHRRNPLHSSQTIRQGTLHAGVVSSTSDLLPLRVPLRAKKSRRCRKELAAGRTGILAKPKVHPLEGDSSLRSSHGKWWKKDSSAVHVVPKVQIVRHERLRTTPTTTHHVLLLKVKNPTIGTVRLRLNGSHASVTTTSGGDTHSRDNLDTDTLLLHDVLIDHTARKYVTARLINTTTASLPPTEVMELHPAEDTLINFGKRQRGDPSEVEGWDAEEAYRRSLLLSDGMTSDCPSLQDVAQKDDIIWLEFVVADNEEGDEEKDASSDEYIAVPLLLEIEIGNGSWDSSFIKPLPVEEGQLDFVSLKLVLVWRPQ